MAEYASIISGSLHKIQDKQVRPPDIPHKNLIWLPVVRTEDPILDPLTEIRDTPVETIDIPGDQYLIHVPKRLLTDLERDTSADEDVDRTFFQNRTHRALIDAELEDLNALRTAPPHNLAARTADEFRTAVRDKIRNG